MPFDSPDYDLADVMRDVGTGRVQLPDFQREWKWDDDRISSLLASISLGYPIGVIMLLQVGGEDVRFKPKALAGVGNDSLRDPEYLLLDGQQRLTSLYQALASKEPVDTVDAKNKKLKRRYYVSIATALDPNADPEDAILAVPEDKVIREDFGRVITADYSTIEKECAAEVFPLDRVYDNPSIFEWHGTYVRQDPSRTERWDEFYARVLENFVRYKLPAIILDKATPKEAVCTVFEKVNTGGVPLNVFELLTATFAADGYALNDDWAERKQRLDRRPALRGVQNTDFLQAVTLLATRERRLGHDGVGVAPAISCKRREILRLTKDEYVRWAEPVTDALEWCANFLALESIFRADDIPYRTQLVPLSAIRAVLGQEADGYEVSDKIRQWYWCGVLGELYGGTTETRFGRDLEQVVPWVAEGSVQPASVDEATFRANRLLTLKTRNSAAYKGIYALLMRHECYDWAKRLRIDLQSFFEFAVDIHHIFPKSWCEKNGIDANRRESIVNKTPLSFETNRSIGGRSPAEYVKSLEAKTGLPSDRVDELIASHRVAPATLRTADFDAFFEDRKGRLLDLIAHAMRKDPVRDDLAGPSDAAEYELEQDELDEEEAVIDIVAATATTSGDALA